jgi:hypothetical protein
MFGCAYLPSLLPLFVFFNLDPNERIRLPAVKPTRD